MPSSSSTLGSSALLSDTCSISAFFANDHASPSCFALHLVRRQGRGLLEGQDLLQGVTPSDTGQTEPPTGSLRQAGRLERSLGPGSVSDIASSSATPPNSSPEQQMRKRLLDSEINEAVTNAADKCELGSEQSCDEAWERVESLSQERDRIDDVG